MSLVSNVHWHGMTISDLNQSIKTLCTTAAASHRPFLFASPVLAFVAKPNLRSVCCMFSLLDDAPTVQPRGCLTQHMGRHTFFVEISQESIPDDIAFAIDTTTFGKQHSN